MIFLCIFKIIGIILVILIFSAWLYFTNQRLFQKEKKQMNELFTYFCISVVAITNNLMKGNNCLNITKHYPVAEAADLSRHVALLRTGLEMEAMNHGDAYSLRVKPKLHLMEDLINFTNVSIVSPKKYDWTYKDESWGAWLAAAWTSRGGRQIAWGCLASPFGVYSHI